MTRKEKFAAAATVVVILLALWRIGAATYEYALWKIDQDAPTIPSELITQPPAFIPDPPPPPSRHSYQLPDDEQDNGMYPPTKKLPPPKDCDPYSDRNCRPLSRI